MAKTITQIRREIRGELEPKESLKIKEKESSKMIRILISKGNKVEASMEVPYEKGFTKIICKWLEKDIKDWDL